MVKPKKKPKRRESEEFPVYNMITLEGVRQREIKYTQSVEALKACLNYLDDILMEMERLNEEHRLLENWEAYLSCDGLPKPYLPPDIRLFFEKQRHFEAKDIEKNLDWTLNVDNRSVLTQNIFRIDKTRDTVKREQLPDFGGEYNKRVDLALQVLKSIEYYLVDEKMTIKAKPRILKDITEQKKSVHNEINAFMDRYTYRILCSEDAYMDDIDARTAEYFYSGNGFQKHIWTIKSVPIIFEFLDDPFMVANLHCIKVRISIPFGILQDNLTIRAIHFEFDAFSEFAKSADQKMTKSSITLNAGITDLRDCLANEWKMQLDLQLETRDQMVHRRLDFEDKKRKYDEEQIMLAKKKKNEKEDDKKKKKRQKLLKEPKEAPTVAENEVPDIWYDFLRKENKEFEDFLNTIYHPDLLKLDWHEVNMKKYFMLGGIYQFDFVSKARHFDFNSFNMTWHENDGKLLIKNNLRVMSPSLAPRQSEDVRKKSTVVNAEENEFDSKISPWFIIRMELPEFLCMWGEPLPCQFEADVTGYIEEKKIEQAPPLHHKTKKGHAAAHAAQAAAEAAQHPQPPLPSADKMAHDRQSVASFMQGSLHSLFHTADRQGSIFRLASMLASSHPDSTIETFQQGIEDFDLNYPLSKSQIRYLARHCLPRIISSYKFPSEFSAEAREKSAKAKSAGGTLVRQRHTAATEDEAVTTARDPDKEERTFTALQQYDPERLFPLFSSPEELNIIMKFIAEQSEQFGPRTFFELIERLDGIKRYYQARPIRTAKLPYFVPNLKLIRPVQKQPHLEEVVGIRSRRSTRSGLSAHTSRASINRSRRTTAEQRKSTMDLPPPQQAQPQPEGGEIAEAGEGEGEGEGEEPKEAVQIVEEEIIDTRKTFKFSRWTTQHIKHFEFDRPNRKLTIWTDRLGIFGLAYKRYEHFPFRYWTLEPSEENPETEVVFTLETQFVKVVLFVTGEGVRGYVTDLKKGFVRNRPMFLVIDQPLKDFRELRKRFKEKNLNIFTERDASFYIENGYFSQKHLATELHTYCCMCTHALLMRFLYSEWNRLASRRDLLLRLVNHKESEEYMCTVRVKPEEATFVTVKELCSDDLDVFNLEYTPTWRNIDFYADVHHLITSMYPSAPEQRVKNPHLIYFLKALLWEIRPLSFS